MGHRAMRGRPIPAGGLYQLQLGAFTVVWMGRFGSNA